MSLTFSARMKARLAHRRRLRSKLAVPMVGNAISQARPLESLGLAVHPDQVREFNEFYRKHGITSAYHKPDGTCVLEARQGRNQVLKLRDYRDQDACYGDYAGKNG